MLGYVLRIPIQTAAKSVEVIPTVRLYSRDVSTTFVKFALFADFNVEMMIPLRTRKSRPSRCFGCKVYRKVRHVFLGSSPTKKEIRGVKLLEQSSVAVLNQGRSSCRLSVRSQTSHVLCPRNATLANFPKLSRVRVPKLCRSRCLSAHRSSCPSTRQDGRGANAFWNLGWVGSRSIGVKRRV